VFSTLSARRHFQVPISGHSLHRAIVEDYSDLGIDEDDEWQEKFADFKMKTSVRRGLFHPNDIKPVGLVPVSPSAKSVSLPDVLNAIGHSHTVAPTEPSHPAVGITVYWPDRHAITLAVTVVCQLVQWLTWEIGRAEAG
jgi:hypothetical protein